MNYYDEKIDDVYKNLNTTSSGLTKKEREKRLERYGLNKIEEIKKKSKIIKFLEQFKDLMIIILLFAALFSFVSALINHEELTDSIIIVVVVILNALMGFFQEEKAESAVEELKKMTNVLTKVKVDNHVETVDSETLVPGDIVLIDAGDKISADCRIVQAFSAKADESILTGESLPVEKNEKKLNKNASLSERSNMLYSGCSLVNGRVIAVVVRTGYDTELGKIATSLEVERDVETPLQKKIDDLSKVLTLIIVLIIIFMVIYGIIIGNDILSIIMLAISLAVAAIPEGLPAVITITLSIGMSGMAKKNAIVRNLKAIETLGSTDIICSDKTGTITENKMTIQEVVVNNKSYKDMNKRIDNADVLEQIFTLCNDVEIDNEGKYVGDPTEIAFLNYMDKLKQKPIDLKYEYPTFLEFPFDSNRKRMSTVHKINGKTVVLVKGSLESIISCCSKYIVDGKIHRLNEKEIDTIKEFEKKMASSSYRVLAGAYKEVKSADNFNEKDAECDLIFVGLVGMIDLPRSSVKASIKECKSAGIRPVMITGDNLNTAIAIGKSIGIIESDEEGIEGKNLDNYTDEELVDVVKNYSVYARVSPEHKVRIVNAWQKNGKVVAMTGDGVNDAPAIKMAHVGVGMGITGTEVTKSVADVILVDDAFSTIVVAVKEGRRIFDNIKNSVLYLLSSNFAEIIIVLLAMFFGYNVFLPIQLLYVNLVTDSIPSICLAFEEASSDIMKRKPHGLNGRFFTPFFISMIVFVSVIMAIATLTSFCIGMHSSASVGMTLAFLTLIMLEIVYSIICRNPHKLLIKQGIFSNKIMNYGIIGVVLLNLIVFLTPIKSLFKINTITMGQFGYVLLITFISFIIIEFGKMILSRTFKDE